MPIYEMVCQDCGHQAEVILHGTVELPPCPACRSRKTEKRISAPSSLSGKTSSSHPGPGDTTCCGSAPSAAGCAGPGSCCGRNGS